MPGFSSGKPFATVGRLQALLNTVVGVLVKLLAKVRVTLLISPLPIITLTFDHFRPMPSKVR